MNTDSTGPMGAVGAWRDRFTARLQQSQHGPIFRVARVVLTLTILGVLVVQLTRVGWTAIFGALPTHPLFYVLLGVVYIALPVTEALIYGRLWGLELWPLGLACARKRVLNDEVLGYSGEVSLYLWGASRGLDTGRVFRAVRDVNIVSSIVSFAVAGGMVALMVAFGELDLTGWAGDRVVGIAVGLFLLVGFILVLRRFQHYVFALSHREAARVAALHLGRHVLTNAALILMWHLVQPTVEIGVWLTFAALLVVVERLPFLPSRDLVFLGTSVELAKTMPVAAAAMAGMLLVQSALFKLLHITVFALAPLSLGGRSERQGLTIDDIDKTSDHTIGEKR